MIASDPVNPNREPSFPEMVARELEKLSREGKIPQVIYSQARDQVFAQAKPLYNIYNRTGRDLRLVIMILLRQVQNRLR